MANRINQRYRLYQRAISKLSFCFLFIIFFKDEAMRLLRIVLIQKVTKKSRLGDRHPTTNPATTPFARRTSGRNPPATTQTASPFSEFIIPGKWSLIACLPTPTIAARSKSPLLLSNLSTIFIHLF